MLPRTEPTIRPKRTEAAYMDILKNRMRTKEALTAAFPLIWDRSSLLGGGVYVRSILPGMLAPEFRRYGIR